MGSRVMMIPDRRKMCLSSACALVKSSSSPQGYQSTFNPCSSSLASYFISNLQYQLYPWQKGVAQINPSFCKIPPLNLHITNQPPQAPTPKKEEKTTRITHSTFPQAQKWESSWKNQKLRKKRFTVPRGESFTIRIFSQIWLKVNIKVKI